MPGLPVIDDLALAAWLGQHALWLTLGGAVPVALLACGLTPPRTHLAAPDAPDVPADTRTLRPRHVIGLLRALAGVLVAALAFAALAGQLGAPGDARRMGRFDEAVIAAVQAALPDTALGAVALWSHLGDAYVLAAIGVIVSGVLWRREHRALAGCWAIALAGNGVVIRVLKHLFERSRPEHLHELAVAWGYSFPSGHASGSMVLYGWCGYLAVRLLPARWHRPAVAACAVLVWTIGCSRVLVQVHFPSDVLAGWLSGGAWLVASVTAVEVARRWRLSYTRHPGRPTPPGTSPHQHRHDDAATAGRAPTTLHGDLT